jgi:hypothetical protein
MPFIFNATDKKTIAASNKLNLSNKYCPLDENVFSIISTAKIHKKTRSIEA